MIALRRLAYGKLSLFRFLVPSLCWLVTAAQAQFAPVWTVGKDDQSNAEFAEEWTVGDLYTVGNPTSTMERALSIDDPFTSLQFNLSAGQITTNARVRLRVDVCGPGWMVPQGQWLGNGWHDIAVSINGAVVLTRATISADQTQLSVEVNNASLPLAARLKLTGNLLRLERTGGSATTPGGSLPWTWMGIDFVSLEIDPNALVDADGDTLPAWWERANLRLDTAAANASADADRDGLTDLQEFAAGTNPDVADTDGDGLSDGAERLVVPLSNP